MNILALDLATTTGFAHSNGQSGAVKLTGSMAEKSAMLADWLERTLATMPADLVALEHAAYGAKFAKTREFHGQLRGVIELVCARQNVPIKMVNIATAKSFATGNGRATKPQMMRVFEFFNKRKPIDDNEADAWAVLVAAQQGAFMVAKPRKKKWKPTTKLKPGMLPGM